MTIIDEDEQRRRQWWANQKLGRHRCVIPDQIGLTHLESGGPGSRWRDHRGATVIGPQMIMAEVEGDARVIFVSWQDFKKLISIPNQGEKWQAANPALMQEYIKTLPQNIPEPARPYEEPPRMPMRPAY